MTETKDINSLRLMELCSAAEIEPGCATKVEKDGLALAVFNIDNAYYVTDDLCTHGPGSLSEGDIDGDVVECDFHNGAFNIKTGEVVAPPCMIPLRTYAVQVIDGRVFIDPDQPAFGLDEKAACPKAV
ncbi:carbazole 1,9a-dioxygenase, ferredoxin component [Noviherbaspirillum humi]|uniref:Carbazole 1,9a-dioxygenase, ferredoxin component n=1 Tax=Noviherbaspirillum humi TaxID=1688639 RepID=A0A239INJ2_9BURK|nr:non-heme iron oxygenase ferredoxin subunit [Noviherbaspirillum humi]SNS94952.1 carbazole 1,9a-dioxygenase, ferredoxin component [Noviherbaspirillum humi]